MPEQADELQRLTQKVAAADLPTSVRDRVEIQISRLARLTGKDYTLEADRTLRWADWVVSLPWTRRGQDRLDLARAREILDQEHYGLEEVKLRILEYLSVLKLRQQHLNRPDASAATQSLRAPILLLVGLVGTGKTTLGFSIAKATGREIARIPFGGMGSARDLRGQSRLHLEAEPGHVIKAMRRLGVKNPVILLDELDRVAEEARHDIMGVLVELLDPEQNRAFLDHYLDIPFDLSEVLFIATANNTGNVATAVMDRMEPISMPSYSDEQKITIAKRYLLPKAEIESEIPHGSLIIDDDTWPMIVRPLGYDAGIRTLQRTIQHLARMTAMNIVTNQHSTIHVTKNNLKQYISNW